MKTLIIYGHTNPSGSNMNKELINIAKENNIDVLTLMEEYPMANIDIEVEQERLLGYDQIILQFPFYWYNAPYIMKKYLDDVFVAGYAFNGPETGKLTGTTLKIVITTGADENSYVPGGYNNEHPTTFLKPFEQMADKMGMIYKQAHIVYESMNPTNLNNEQVRAKYTKFINE